MGWGFVVSILSSLLSFAFICSNCQHFFVLIVYISLFTFVLAYCVNKLSSLDARLISEHSGGKEGAKSNRRPYDRATTNFSA